MAVSEIQTGFTSTLEQLQLPQQDQQRLTQIDTLLNHGRIVSAVIQTGSNGSPNRIDFETLDPQSGRITHISGVRPSLLASAYQADELAFASGNTQPETYQRLLNHAFGNKLRQKNLPVRIHLESNGPAGRDHNYNADPQTSNFMAEKQDRANHIRRRLPKQSNAARQPSQSRPRQESHVSKDGRKVRPGSHSDQNRSSDLLNPPVADMYHVDPRQLPNEQDQNNLRDILIHHADQLAVVGIENADRTGGSRTILSVSTEDGSVSYQFDIDQALMALLGIDRNRFSQIPTEPADLALALSRASYNQKNRRFILEYNGQRFKPDQGESYSTQRVEENQPSSSAASAEPADDARSYREWEAEYYRQAEEDMAYTDRHSEDIELAWKETEPPSPEDLEAAKAEAHQVLDEIERTDEGDDKKTTTAWLEKNAPRLGERWHKRNIDPSGKQHSGWEKVENSKTTHVKGKGDANSDRHHKNRTNKHPLYRKDGHYRTKEVANAYRREKAHVFSGDGRNQFKENIRFKQKAQTANLDNPQEFDLDDHIPDNMHAEEQEHLDWWQTNAPPKKPKNISEYKPKEWTDFAAQTNDTSPPNHANNEHDNLAPHERTLLIGKMISPEVNLTTWPEPQHTEPDWWQDADQTTKKAYSTLRHMGKNPLKWQGSGNAPWWFREAADQNKPLLNILAESRWLENGNIEQMNQVAETIDAFIDRRTDKPRYSRSHPDKQRGTHSGYVPNYAKGSGRTYRG